MAWERSIKLVCPVCRATGELVCDWQGDPYAPRQIVFKSLTRGFTYKSSGTIDSMLVICLSCNVKVDLTLDGQP